MGHQALSNADGSTDGTPLAPTRTVRFGPYELDPHGLRKYGLKVKLSGHPLELLLLLVEHSGELVTREELRDRLWPEGVFVDFEPSLNGAVKRLRRTLNDDPQEPRYIETCPRQGYRFIGVLEPQPANETDDLANGTTLDADAVPALLPGEVSNPDSKAVEPASQSRVAARRYRRIAMTGIVALIAVAAFLAYRFTRTSPPVASLTPVRHVQFRSSIAVLGFKNLSSRRDADWLSTAITQMLATELARGEKVRIIPDEDLARAKFDLGLKEKDVYSLDTLRALRTDVGSDYVVTGSYAVVGHNKSGQVRVDLRLLEAISGETLASIAVSGNQSEIFELVSRAGQQMRVKLGSTVAPEGDVDWRTVLPANPAAARLYSEGLSHLRVFENLAASEPLQRSIAIEPSFALAHVALAEAWSAVGYDARALASARQALSLSNSLPEDERLEIEGLYYELKRDWPGAIGVYRHLWHDFPDDLDSGLKLAAAQASAGDTNEALATLSSLRSFPGLEDPRIDLTEASIAARNKDYPRQQVLAENAVEKARSSGARLLMARAHLLTGAALHHQSKLSEATKSYSAARLIFEEAGDRDGSATALTQLGIVLSESGDLVGSRDRLEKAREYFRQIGNEIGLAATLTNLAEVSRAQGDLRQARELYREALDIFARTGRNEEDGAPASDLRASLYNKSNFQSARAAYESLLESRKADDPSQSVIAKDKSETPD